jgi:hypothetical protein
VSASLRQTSREITLQLKISLLDTDPVVWRRVLVPGAMPLNKLHSVFQAVMGWEDRHLHVFDIHGKRYGIPDTEEEEDEEELDEYGVRIHPLLDENDHFRYEYDFGDSWLHNVEVEAVNHIDEPLLQAICTAGASACPPEDCGGTSGFADFVKVMVDPTRREHRDVVESFGRVFDPDLFSLTETNKRIQRIR